MNINWNTAEYSDNFKFVHQYGEDVIGLLTVDSGSLVVDLGCGNGALTEKLDKMGFQVIGIDGSENMIEMAKKTYPQLDFVLSDALDFTLEKKADAVFSNAVFHWIDADKQDKLIKNINKNLVLGGELVFEFGGFGCAETVHTALQKAFEKRNLSYKRTFYFPTIGEYAPILEKNGFRVEYATLFDRFTQQKNDLAEWINMFVKAPFIGVDENIKNEIVEEAVNVCKKALLLEDKWYVDYVRIRMRATKFAENN